MDMPSSGGSWIRDLKTGTLVRAEAPAAEPVALPTDTAPAAPAAADPASSKRAAK